MPADLDLTPAAVPTALPSDATHGEATHGLADDLHRLHKAANGMPITVSRLLDTLEDRGLAVAILVLAAPFVLIPIPGISTVVGAVLLALSIGVLANSKPWLPKFISRRELSAATLHRLTGGADRMMKRLERFTKPRMEWLAGKRWHWLAGISLIAATIAFALPLPIPGNNIPPAIALVLVALGLLERDGLMLLVGHIYTLVMWLIILAAVIIFWEAVDGYVHRLWTKVSGMV